MKRAILEQLIKKCQKDLQAGRHPQKDNFIHWTFLIKENTVLSCGVNRAIEPPIYYGYHNVLKCDSSSFIPKWHSELDALNRANFSLRNYTAVNVRLSKAGLPRLSLPCVACRRILNVMRCKKIFFTTETGWGILE